MHIKKYMHEIIEHGDLPAMEWLGNVFVDLVYNLREHNANWYKGIELEMHKMACGNHIGEHFAKKWVANMKNKDGTGGAHWTFEQTEQVRKQYKLEFDCWDFYATMNMFYSDDYKPNTDITYYLELAKNWLDDPDGKADKTLRFYIYVIE